MIPLPISVVICAYSLERWDELTAAVRSLRRQTMPPHEIIIVADHNQSLFERIRDEIPDVIAIENHEPQGLAGARNSGLGVAQGEIIAFLDDDAIAGPDWLERLHDGYDDPSVSGIGGAIEPVWSTGRPRWFPIEFDWVVGCSYRGMPERTAPVRNLIGANMSFRRSVFESVGGFRSGIGRIGTRPVGCEETEFCIRATQRLPGTSFLFEPRARIEHHVPAGRATWSYFRRRCHAEGRSKVLVSRFVGTNDGLSSERAYMLRTLPAGVLRGLSAAVRQGDPSGVARASAIVAGVTITTVAYLTGGIRPQSARNAPVISPGSARSGASHEQPLVVSFGKDSAGSEIIESEGRTI